MSSMHIRPFQPADEDAVIALWQTCGLVVPQNNPRRDIARKLCVNPGWFLVGENDGKIIATCMAGYEGHRGWINYLATHPDEVRALGGMSHEKALIHLGKLSIALEQPKDPPKAEQPRVSKAPTPITPIGAGGDPPTVSFDKQLADLVERGDFDRWRQLKSSAKR